MALPSAADNASFQDRIGALLALDETGTEPLARQLTRALRRAIVTTRILPGQMLSEQEIAGTLGISRQPVREAIINLRDLGLIRVMPQRGTRVNKISLRAVEDARFTREAIECAVVREAARLRDDAGLDALRRVAEEHRIAAEAVDNERFFTLDEAFHRTIATLARRPAVWDTIEMVKPQMDRVRFLDIDTGESIRMNVSEHEAVVEAIAAADPEAASEVMARHLRSVRPTVLRLRDRLPEMFEED